MDKKKSIGNCDAAAGLVLVYYCVIKVVWKLRQHARHPAYLYKLYTPLYMYICTYNNKLKICINSFYTYTFIRLTSFGTWTIRTNPVTPSPLLILILYYQENRYLNKPKKYKRTPRTGRWGRDATQSTWEDSVEPSMPSTSQTPIWIHTLNLYTYNVDTDLYSVDQALAGLLIQCTIQDTRFQLRFQLN